jgi:anthranilate phosphoribosyltransferase
VVSEYEIHPEDFGIAMAASRNLRVNDATESKAMLLDALSGKEGLPREIVALNSGAALYAAGTVDSIAAGIAKARAAIASGAARAKLDEFVNVTRELAK